MPSLFNLPLINLKNGICFLILLSIINCNSLIKRKSNIKEIEFDYKNISENYFTPENDKPFPLTVQKGNNIHNATTKDGKYLYFLLIIKEIMIYG